MDTDDLSIPTYDGILGEAGKFHRDLTLQFGLLATQCKDDDDYLNKAEEFAIELIHEKDFGAIIDDLFFGENVSEADFRKTLNNILSNIKEIRKTPMEQRDYEDW